MVKLNHTQESTHDFSRQELEKAIINLFKKKIRENNGKRYMEDE